MLIAALLAQVAVAGPANGEAELAKALAGRRAGTAVTCIPSRFVRYTRVIDGVAVIYEMSDRRWYVQRPQQNADLLSDAESMVSRSPLGTLCRTDLVDLQDRSTRIRTGFVTLGEFVPYDRER